MRLTDLEEVAGVHYPISGDLSAKLSLKGSQLDPKGSGTIEIANGRAGDEPLKTVLITFRGENGSITSHLQIASDAGSTNGDLNTRREPKPTK